MLVLQAENTKIKKILLPTKLTEMHKALRGNKLRTMGFCNSNLYQAFNIQHQSEYWLFCDYLGKLHRFILKFALELCQYLMFSATKFNVKN